MKQTRPRIAATGFTLIELMIVVAIVGVLAAIAYPGYQSSVQRSWRTNAAACLTGLAQGMERHFTASTRMTYAFLHPDGSEDTDARDAFLAAGCTQENGMASRYTFSFAANPTATAFNLRAVPVGTGPQASDGCGTLTVNELGQKGSGGSVSDCWRR